MIRHSNIVVTEGSITEPVTLAEAKAWLRVTANDEDDLIDSMITGARQSIENFLDAALVEKDVTVDIENTAWDYKTTILPKAFGAVDTVVVNKLDGDDQETLLTDAEDYFLRGTSIRIPSGRFSVSYTVIPGTITQDLKEAILMEVAQRFENRGENAQAKNGLSEGAKEKAFSYANISI